MNANDTDLATQLRRAQYAFWISAALPAFLVLVGRLVGLNEMALYSAIGIAPPLIAGYFVGRGNRLVIALPIVFSSIKIPDTQLLDCARRLLCYE